MNAISDLNQNNSLSQKCQQNEQRVTTAKTVTTKGTIITNNNNMNNNNSSNNNNNDLKIKILNRHTKKKQSNQDNSN